jgi:hypothetical protein
MALIKSFFEVKNKSELEMFLEQQNPQNIQELEFWMAEFDHRKRIASKLQSEGRYQEAQLFVYQ